MSPGAYGLVGMGAVFAAATRAPITGVIIIFELTGDYKIILPLMLAIVIATALSNAVTKDTIYTLKLRRRGIDIDTPRILSPMAQITVAEERWASPHDRCAPRTRCRIWSRGSQPTAPTRSRSSVRTVRCSGS